MIYGANGYTGELIAREAISRGLKPVLAGQAARPGADQDIRHAHSNRVCPDQDFIGLWFGYGHIETLQHILGGPDELHGFRSSVPEKVVHVGDRRGPGCCMAHAAIFELRKGVRFCWPRKAVVQPLT